MKIELKILKKDMLLDNYLDHNSCPITKALHRAGYKYLFDCGDIIDEKNNTIANNDNKSYKELLIKLFGMYNSFVENKMGFPGETIKEIPVKTFTHILNIPKKLLNK